MISDIIKPFTSRIDKGYTRCKIYHYLRQCADHFCSTTADIISLSLQKIFKKSTST